MAAAALVGRVQAIYAAASLGGGPGAGQAELAKLGRVPGHLLAALVLAWILGVAHGAR